MKAEIIITLKKSVRDPQGEAIAASLGRMGLDDIKQVRQGKHIEIEFGNKTTSEIETEIKLMCEKLLANPVIENYQVKMGK